MFAQGSRVIYGIHGVCTVKGIEERLIDRKKVAYYVLSPEKQPNDRFYIPTENPAAVAKLKPILSKNELDALLCSPEATGDAWIADENQRKQRYRELITSGNRAALISMVKALHMHKDSQLAQGRKMHMCDENFLRDAENLLSGEFSLVLGITPDEVGVYIQNKINPAR